MGSQESWTRLKRLSMQEGIKSEKPTGDMCVRAAVTRQSHWRPVGCHNCLGGSVSSSHPHFMAPTCPLQAPGETRSGVRVTRYLQTLPWGVCAQL